MKEWRGADVKVYRLTDHYNQSWICYRAWLEAAIALQALPPLASNAPHLRRNSETESIRHAREPRTVTVRDGVLSSRCGPQKKCSTSHGTNKRSPVRCARCGTLLIQIIAVVTQPAHDVAARLPKEVTSCVQYCSSMTRSAPAPALRCLCCSVSRCPARP
jgi:hypothetical protein